MFLFVPLAPLGRFGVQFGRPLDFEWVPKSIVFLQNQNNVIKKGVQEGVLKKHDFQLIYDAKIGVLEK